MFWIVKVLTSVCPGKENNTNDSEQNFAYFTNDCQFNTRMRYNTETFFVTTGRLRGYEGRYNETVTFKYNFELG